MRLSGHVSEFRVRRDLELRSDVRMPNNEQSCRAAACDDKGEPGQAMLREWLINADPRGRSSAT